MNARPERRPPRPWIATWIALTLGIVSLAGRPAAAQLAWLQVPAGCPPGTITPGDLETPQAFSCGGLGTFVFGRPGLRYQGGSCGVIDGLSVEPALLPAEPEPALPPAFPCAGGSCLGRTTPGRPWVAMLDWPDEHGWSVAAAIQEASDQRLDVELLDLTRAGGLAQWVPSVSDLHVLYQLCGLAERARKNLAERPLAVNLSFGRHKAGGDDCTAGPTPGCAIRRALAELAGDGIVPVAAAGNHRELLFPAASPGVLSAGALDLAYYQYAGAPRPSSQTPSAARALLLGYGLYLSVPGVDGETSTWAAPPGSSYAAALLTGWLGGYLAGGGTLPPTPPGTTSATWTPVRTGSGLALSYGGALLPGSELAGPRVLFERALGALPGAQAPPGAVTLKLAGPAPGRPPLSILYADDGNVPQPGVDPCLPCRIGSGGQQESPGTLTLDLSASAGLPSLMELQAIWLRVGPAFYGFDLSTDPDLLGKLAAGSLPALALSGVAGLFPPGEQPSLVLVVEVDKTSYWHEVPIQLKP